MAKESNVSLFWFGLVAVVVIIVSLNALLSRQQTKEAHVPATETTVTPVTMVTSVETVGNTGMPEEVPLPEPTVSVSPTVSAESPIDTSEVSSIPVVIIDTSQTIKPIPDPIVADVIVTETAPAAIPIVTDVIVSDTPPPPEVSDNVQIPGLAEWGLVSLPEGGALLFPPVESAVAMPADLAQHIQTLLAPSGWQLTEEGDMGWILWTNNGM